MFFGALPSEPKNYTLRRGQLYTFVFDATDFWKPSITTVKERLKFVNVLQASHSFGTEIGTGTLRYYVSFTPISDITFDRFIEWSREVGSLNVVDLIVNQSVAAPTAVQQIREAVVEVARIPGEAAKATLDPIKTLLIVGVIGYALFVFTPLIQTLRLKR